MSLACDDKFEYAGNIKDFAKQIVWYPCRERDVNDLDEFLVFLLAHGGEKAIQHARKRLGITDKDFRRAIVKARPGAFVSKEDWESVNAEIGIIPPLPYPVLDLGKIIAEAQLLKVES